MITQTGRRYSNRRKLLRRDTLHELPRPSHLPLRLGSRCPNRRRHALIGAGFILEKSWTFPEVRPPTDTSRRNFSFSTTLIPAARRNRTLMANGHFRSEADVHRRVALPAADSERFRSTPRTCQPMLGIRRPVCRASALKKRAGHYERETTDRSSCRSICWNTLSNWVLLESNSS
jgi:hypothetical protein